MSAEDRTTVRLRKAYFAAIKLRHAIEKQPVKAVRILMIPRAAVEEYDRRIEELKKEKESE